MDRAVRKNSLRLPGFDYASPRSYFITIRTFSGDHLFGEIRGGSLATTALGEFATENWQKIPSIHDSVTLDEFVFMPNHMHAVLQLNENGGKKSLSRLVQSFKRAVTIWARKHTDIHYVWQRNFHDHIVRNQNDLDRIRTYIVNNPRNWETDALNRSTGSAG